MAFAISQSFLLLLMLEWHRSLHHSSYWICQPISESDRSITMILSWSGRWLGEAELMVLDHTPSIWRFLAFLECMSILSKVHWVCNSHSFGQRALMEHFGTSEAVFNLPIQGILLSCRARDLRHSKLVKLTCLSSILILIGRIPQRRFKLITPTKQLWSLVEVSLSTCLCISSENVSLQLGKPCWINNSWFYAYYSWTFCFFKVQPYVSDPGWSDFHMLISI